MSYSLMIHGGAGTRAESLAEDRIGPSLNIILEQGRALLQKGASALETVALCVELLENDPLYNAGFGAIANAQGEYELDAAIMDGHTLSCGAVACVRTVRNPVLLAQAVMNDTKHVMLCGAGAEAFAERVGVEPAGRDYFVRARPPSDLSETHGTVGAVARDIHGHVAAATSTGGWTAKMPGRIGDTPLIGSGTYADDAGCAVSCTGHGEMFIRANIAAYTSFIAETRGLDAQAAAKAAIERLTRKLSGIGGLIAVDRHGNVGASQSSPFLRHGWIEKGGDVQTALRVA